MPSTSLLSLDAPYAAPLLLSGKNLLIELSEFPKLLINLKLSFCSTTTMLPIMCFEID